MLIILLALRLARVADELMIGPDRHKSIGSDVQRSQRVTSVIATKFWVWAPETVKRSCNIRRWRFDGLFFRLRQENQESESFRSIGGTWAVPILLLKGNG